MEKIKREIRGTVSVTCSKESEESRMISGRAIVFDEPTVLYEDEKYVLKETISSASISEVLLCNSDIKMTMFHNPELILARSKKGEGTLKWRREDDGIYFEFEAPKTADGNKAYELVRSQVIDGCSFWAYANQEDIEEKREKNGAVTVVSRTINKFISIEDFTLTPNPAFPQTSVDIKREIDAIKKREEVEEKKEDPYIHNIEEIIQREI